MRKKCECYKKAAPTLVPYSNLLFKTIEEVKKDASFHVPGMYAYRVGLYGIRIGFSQKISIFSAIRKVHARQKDRYPLFARIPFEREHVQCTREYIKKTYADLPIDNVYLHIKNIHHSHWLSFFPCAEVYGPQKKQWFFPDRKRKSGIYFIWQDGVLVYIGKSIRNLSETANGHFSPYRENRYYPHYRVCFSETKFEKKYEVAFLEVSPYWFKSEEEFLYEVGSLEKKLISTFSSTLYNIKGVIKKENEGEEDFFDFSIRPDSVIDFVDDEPPF